MHTQTKIVAIARRGELALSVSVCIVALRVSLALRATAIIVQELECGIRGAARSGRCVECSEAARVGHVACVHRVYGAQ